MKERLHLDATTGQAREVSAKPPKLKARTDWTFTFADTTIPLPQGEPRIDVDLAGDEIASGAPLHLRARGLEAAGTRRRHAIDDRQILAGVVFGGLLVAAAVLGVIAWSRRRYAPRVFVLAALMLAASVVNAANGWPTIHGLALDRAAAAAAARGRSPASGWSA